MATNVIVHCNNIDFEETIQKFCNEVKESNLLWEIKKHGKKRKS